MGTCKPLLPLAGRPVILHSFEALQGGGIADIILVAGADGDAVCEVLAGMHYVVAWNREPESDMAGSIRLGLQAIPPHCTGVLVHLADYPLVRPETITTLIAGHEAHPEQIIIPVYQGRSGHPALFPSAVLAEIYKVATLRDIVRRDAARLLSLEVNDCGILTDMDTPRDYERLRENYGKNI